MTSAKFLGFLTPSPLVSILDQSIVLKSRNLPYCIRIWRTASLPLSADVICEWPQRNFYSYAGKKILGKILYAPYAILTRGPRKAEKNDDTGKKK